MHLAVCDDHIADRKQMERLLGRESDRRISTTGVLYVDSYGSKNSILITPMIYDAIFMDMTEDGCDAVELANMLRADGTMIPIVFCCGKLNYRTADNLPENVLFLDKPIVADELSRMIDTLLSIKSHQVKKLEFRNRTETYYLKEEDIFYALPEGSRNMRLHLSDGSNQLAEMNLETFCGNLSECACFVRLNCSVVLNMLYIKDINFFKVTMEDGRQFRLSFGESRALQKLAADCKKSTGASSGQ